MARKEVVVIGGGIGGLSAAIYARLAGHQVCLLESTESIGGKAAEVIVGGYRLDPGPSIIILTRVYEALFRDAGRNIKDYLRFKRLDPISKVYFGDQPPIDLPADRAECERLVDDISASDGESFRRLMAKLDVVSPLVDRTVFARPFDRPSHLINADLIVIGAQLNLRQSFKDRVDQMFQSPLLRAFFYGFPSYGGQSYYGPSVGGLLIPYLMVNEGVYYPNGGVSSIPKAMLRLGMELGVDVRTKSHVKRLVQSGSTVKAVELADGSTIQGDSFISGVDRLTAQAWVGKESSQEPNYSYFTVHLGVKKKLTGLSHHTLLIPEDFEKGFQDLYDSQKFPNPPIVYLNETSAIDEAVAPSGCSNLFAVVTSPAKVSHIDWECEATDYRNRIMETLSKFGFSISSNDIDFERIQSPEYFERVHGNYKGSLYGAHESKRLFGMFPQSNRDLNFKNLFYCGASVQPGAGLPMVTLSGKFAARMI